MVMEMMEMNLPWAPYIDESGAEQQLSLILVKLSTDASYGPDEDKPDVLITCGTHPREWATSESCLAFIDHMVKGAYSPLPDPEVTELLESLEIWVVPFVSPGGRYYDDDRLGDSAGNGWGDPDVNAAWRKNRQWFDVFDCASDWGTRDFSGKCDTATLGSHYGINVARNFSAGWDQYPPWHVAAEVEKCMDLGTPAQPVVCGNDIDCQSLSASDTTTSRCLTNSVLFCDTSGECAFNRRATCCDTNFGGLRPFESIEARLVRHIALNIPIVTVLEAHSFHGILGRVPKRGPYPDTTPGGSLTIYGITRDDHLAPPVAAGTGVVSYDVLNMNFVQSEAIAAYNDASEEAWRAAHDPTGNIPDFMLMAGQVHGTGSGAGQLTAWMAEQPEPMVKPFTYSSGIEDNFDNETYRGINAYLVELPPRGGVDPLDPDWPNLQLCEYNDGPEYSPYIECAPAPLSGSTNQCFYPDSQLAAKTITAGFIGLAKYISRDALHPNVGRRRSGDGFDGSLYVSYAGSSDDGLEYWDYRYGQVPDPTYTMATSVERADTAVTGLLVQDGGGRGVLQGEFAPDVISAEYTAKIFLPAGNWLVSSDVVYENFREDPAATPPWDSDYEVTISLDPLATSTSASCVPSSYTFYSGTVSPGEARHFARRMEFEAGCDYLVTAELAWAGDNDTAVNDIRTLKVHTTACDSVDRPSHLGPSGYCNRRIHEDVAWAEDDFTCIGGECKECFAQGSSYSGCEGSEFCVNGMCDDPWECWSGSIEDDFEDLYIFVGASERHFEGGDGFTFTGTLHLDSGGQDVDRTSWSRADEGPSQIMLFYNKVELAVMDMCDGATGVHYPFTDIEARVLLETDSIWFTTHEELIPWFTPEFMIVEEAWLTADQRQKVEDGSRIVVELRNVEDTASPGTFPSLSYRAHVTVGTGLGSLVLGASGSMVIPPTGNISIGSNLVAEDEAFKRLEIPDDMITSADTVYFRPTEQYESPEEAPTMLVVDKLDDIVAVGEIDDLGGTGARLQRLPLDNAPYSVVLAAGSRALEGDLYRCPNVQADGCFDYESERACAGESCGDGEICCVIDPNGGLGCVDALTDETNCGGCGNGCFDNETCLSGVCAEVTGPECGGTACPGDLDCCEDENGAPTCVSKATNTGNCGWCGHECPYWASCQGGVCVPRSGDACDATCSDGAECCFELGWEVCVDTGNDELNCGGCGVICGWGETCREGACVPWLSVYDPCLFGRVNCGAPYELECANLGKDESNCGSSPTMEITEKRHARPTFNLPISPAAMTSSTSGTSLAASRFFLPNMFSKNPKRPLAMPNSPCCRCAGAHYAEPDVQDQRRAARIQS